ncbi:MAG: DUF5811 family protein [Halobacteriaceae archaeon]
MNGNTPYAGKPGVVEAGQRSEEDVRNLTPDQRRALRDSLARIASQTRDLLPEEYIVGSEITAGANGLRATIAVRPPVGNPVSAGLQPQFNEDGDEEGLPIKAGERQEVAQGLAASAALQVKQALANADDEFTPTAR